MQTEFELKKAQLELQMLAYQRQFEETQMGCDIHQYAEYRKDGVWYAEQAAKAVLTKAGEKDEYDDIMEKDRLDLPDSGNRSRNYGLFGLLSEGVRYDTPHAFEPKGEPEDASKEVLMTIAQWQGDGHSHNYLTFQELKEKKAEMLLLNDRDAQEYQSILRNWIESFGPNPEGVSDEDRRVVFFFDN